MKTLSPLGPGEAFLVTANRLLDGRIVWRDQSGKWREDIRQAVRLTADEASACLDDATAQAQKEGVVGVYEVRVKAGPVPQPVSMREHLRAFGPTVHPDFAYPSASSVISSPEPLS